MSKRKRQDFEKSPPITCLKDLITIGNTIEMYSNINMLMLWQILPYIEELDSLIGMENLKHSIFQQILYYIQDFHTNNVSEEYLHTVLMGPPGTGKTTVAHIISNIYKHLGILSSDGIVKIAHKDDFVAGYVGQTAIKTQKLLKSCIGGVLFIDEAYSFGQKNSKEESDSFSKEAIDILTSFLSEHSNDFCCIIAGYEQDIKNCFFSINKGLESRFQWKHVIDDYSSTNLKDILLKKISINNWHICCDDSEIVSILESNKELFKNYGRDIVSLFNKCKISHAVRVINLVDEYKYVLTRQDILGGIELIKKVKDKKNDSELFYKNLYI